MSYYKAVSLRTIPEIESRIYALPESSNLSLTIEINGTQYTKLLGRSTLTWPWYNNGGGVEQSYLFDWDLAPVNNGNAGDVSWIHDDQGAYRVEVAMSVPFSVVQLTADDSDLDYLMNFGAVEFVDNTPVNPDPIPDQPEEPTMTTPTYGAGLLSAVVTAAALRAQLDEQVGWHKSLSNVVVNGPTGMSQAITWDLEDPDTDAGYLNSHDITTMIQHQGFRFWGNRNCSSDLRFAFEVATRTAQTVLETIVQGCFPFMDQPLTPQLAKDIIDSINAKLDAFVAAGVLIGARCWYDDAQNNSQDLSQGQLWVDYDYTPVPTLENLGLNQRITDRYLVDFAKLIAQAA